MGRFSRLFGALKGEIKFENKNEEIKIELKEKGGKTRAKRRAAASRSRQAAPRLVHWCTQLLGFLLVLSPAKSPFRNINAIKLILAVVKKGFGANCSVYTPRFTAVRASGAGRESRGFAALSAPNIRFILGFSFCICIKKKNKLGNSGEGAP